MFNISSVQLLNHVWLFATPWTAACQASLIITNSQSPPKSMSIESVMLSNHLILCRSLLLPSIFPSISVFSSESAVCIRWPKYCLYGKDKNRHNKGPLMLSFYYWCAYLYPEMIRNQILIYSSSLVYICCNKILHREIDYLDISMNLF